MLDTLKLSLTDFEIMGDACLDVQAGTFNAATGELSSHYPLWCAGGRTVTGSKAFYNADEFNVTVKPVRDDEPMAISCQVQFSVPKVATGSNYEPADFEATKSALKAINSELKGIGIKTNLKTATLSRLDSCKTVNTIEGYQAYEPVLRAMRGKRVRKRDYSNSFLWHNTVQEICVYDKIEEMRVKNRNVAGLPVNSVRFEHRLLKARKIRDSIGLSSVSDLLSGFEQVREGYAKAMRQQLFYHSPEEVQALTVQGVAEQLEHFKATGSRYYVRDYLVAQGVARMAESMDTLLLAVESVSDSRMTLYRARKQVDTAQFDALAMLCSSHSSRTLKDLYNELECAVVGE
jgi:hypothetical protein